MNILFLDKINNHSISRDFWENYSNIPLFYADVLRNYGYNVHFLNGNDPLFSRDIIYEIIIKNKINKVIINTNIDNIKSVSRLKLKEKYQNVEIILFLINEDISKIIHIQDIADNFILFNEKFDFATNINLFFKKLKIIDFQDIECDPDIHEANIEMPVSINIGTGCARSCMFCSISNSQIKYRNINDIIKEIRELLNNGINYFHIANHNFTKDISFVKELCNKLITEFSNIDYVWSCYAVPEYLFNNLDILYLLKKAKLERIEFSVESGCDEIISNMGINSNTQINQIVIHEAFKSKITLIVTDFILGSPNENYDSLANSKEFIFQILDLTLGTCDINLNSFYPEVGSTYFNNGINLIQKAGILDCVKVKDEFVMDSKFLTKMDLNAWRYNIRKEIFYKRSSLIYKISPEGRYNFMDIKKYNINSQLYINHLSKTFLADLNDYRKQSMCSSWDIKDDLNDYTPILHVKELIEFNEKKVLFTDPTFSEGNQPLQIEFEWENLFNYMKDQITVREITQKLTIDYNIDINIVRNNIMKIFSELEKYHLLSFTKFLN